MEHELIYHFRTVFPVNSRNLNQLFQELQSYYSEHNITSCLLFHNNEALQLIEGEKEALEIAFEKILENKGYRDVFLINMQAISSRLFDSQFFLNIVDTEKFRMMVPLNKNLSGFKNQPLIAQILFSHISDVTESPQEVEYQEAMAS